MAEIHRCCAISPDIACKWNKLGEIRHLRRAMRNIVLKTCCNQCAIYGNRFVADIYIKPARSINFIQLNFVATRTGVNFSEVGA